MNPWLEKDGVRYAYFSDVMKRAALCKSPTTRSFRTSWNSGIVRNSEAIMALGKVGKIFIRVRPARAARARRNPLDGQQIKIPPSRRQRCRDSFSARRSGGRHTEGEGEEIRSFLAVRPVSRPLLRLMVSMGLGSRAHGVAYFL